MHLAQALQQGVPVHGGLQPLSQQQAQFTDEMGVPALGAEEDRLGFALPGDQGVVQRLAAAPQGRARNQRTM